MGFKGLWVKGFRVSESPTAPLGLGFGCGTALSNYRLMYPGHIDQSLVSMNCMVMLSLLSMRLRSERPYKFSIGVNRVLTNCCHRSCSSLSHPVTVIFIIAAITASITALSSTRPPSAPSSSSSSSSP